MRVRISFSKTEAMCYTGHLDLHHTWERTLRRARLPLAYSQGFNPRPKINLASALPLGFTSQAELVDVILDSELPLGEVETRLIKAAPPGIQVAGVEAIPQDSPKLQRQLAAAEYTLTLLEPFPDLETSLESLLEASQLPRQRRGKPYDLRPLILDLHVLPPDESGCPRFLARLSARDGATGRPDEVLLALGADPLAARIHRTALLLE
jgi:radical SAM-linked protein